MFHHKGSAFNPAFLSGGCLLDWKPSGYDCDDLFRRNGDPIDIPINYPRIPADFKSRAIGPATTYFVKYCTYYTKSVSRKNILKNIE